MKNIYNNKNRPTAEEISKYFTLVLLFITSIVLLGIKIPLSNSSVKPFYILLLVVLVIWFPYFLFMVIRRYHFFIKIDNSLTEFENTSKIRELLQTHGFNFSTDMNHGNILLIIEKKQLKFLFNKSIDFITTVICLDNEILLLTRPYNSSIVTMVKGLVVPSLIKTFFEKGN